ncbi:MAG TPA: hypothetical protein PKD59_06385 [Miltoncostaeaceae bacterium]|nr:hypothetical protein [Miltoncostaeaceae bacterium]
MTTSSPEATGSRWRRAATFGPGTAGAVRAGLVVLALTIGVNLANYLFQVVSARYLGPSDYGALAALLAVILVAGLPFGAFQLVVARTVAHERTHGRLEDAAAFARSALALTAIGGLICAVVSIAAAQPIADLLQVESPVPIMITGLCLLFAVMLPAGLGVLQGQERYVAYSAGPLLGAMSRLLALVMAVVVGLTLEGALVATLLASFLAITIVVWQGRTLLRAGMTHHHVRTALQQLRGPLARVLPPTVGLIGLASLTNVDIVVVKGALAPEDAGVFGAAGLIAKVALFVPVAIVAVLQPRVAARVAKGRTAGDILMRSALVTAAFCALFTLACYAMPTTIVHAVYGSSFGDAAAILGEYALFISMMSIVSVQVNYHLSRQRYRFGYVLGVAAVLHAITLVAFHDTLREVLWVNLAFGAVLLLTHELWVQRTLVGLTRRGAAQA